MKKKKKKETPILLTLIKGWNFKYSFQVAGADLCPPLGQLVTPNSQPLVLLGGRMTWNRWDDLQEECQNSTWQLWLSSISPGKKRLWLYITSYVYWHKNTRENVWGNIRIWYKYPLKAKTSSCFKCVLVKASCFYSSWWSSHRILLLSFFPAFCLYSI